MIALIGDIHGEFGPFANKVSGLSKDIRVVQLGDFGWWPRMKPYWLQAKIDRPVLAIDGNHDHQVYAPVAAWPDAEFVPRGDVRKIDGRRVLFLGGATSVDRAWREPRGEKHGWFDEEIPSEADVARALSNADAVGGVDLMLTHTPPDWMIRKHFGPDGLRYFGHDPLTWRDVAAERIEQVWRTLDKPPLYCGHMHRGVVDGVCRILDIHELVIV